MRQYVARRILWGVVLLFIVSALVFVIFYALPSGDPATARAGRLADAEDIQRIRDSLGLDEPIYVQYWIYMKGLILDFDFGYSYQSNSPVLNLIVDRLPATFSLVAGAVILWVLIGVTTGIVSAVRRGSLLDRATMITTLVLISAPVFWLGLVFLYLFADDIGGLAPILPGQGSYVPLTESPGEWVQSLVLPWIVLAAAIAAVYARYLRSSMTDVMAEDYIRTARSKGLSERRVILRHGVRSAITPVVTLLALDVGTLLAGNAILTESVFNIPGVGKLIFTAIDRSDLPIIQGVVLFGAFFIVSLNLIVDIAYAYLDPRVRYR